MRAGSVSTSGWLPRLRSASFFVLVFLLIEAVYTLYCSAGRNRWPEYNRYHDWLADAFVLGQLHLPVDPAPELVAAKNPLDPRLAPYWLPDATLHNGKFYVYWGPVPGLLQAAVKYTFSIHRALGDQYLVFGFFSASALACLALSKRLWRSDPGSRPIPVSLRALAISSVALSYPFLYLVATPGVYQGAIAGGQAFTLLGMVAAVLTIEKASAARYFGLTLTGFLFALAVGCRVTVAPTVVLIALALMVFGAKPGANRLRQFLLDGVCLGVPLALMGATLLWYNYARFGSIFEFGTTTQLSNFPRFGLSVRYWLPNWYAYLFSPFGVTCQFPYFIQSSTAGPKGLPSWINHPPGYYAHEPVVGLLIGAPITCLALACVPFAVRRFLQSWKDTPRASKCLAASLVVLMVSGALVVFGVFLGTMRYLVDFAYGALLLALWLLFSQFQRLASWKRPAFGAAIALACLSTIVCGLLLGTQGYDNQFQARNPPLFERVRRSASLCPPP
jgi:hypothetical protein